MIRFPLRSARARDPDDQAALLRSGLRTGQPGRAGSGPVVLSRALYRLRGFDLSAVAPRERPAAMRHLVAAWAPFEQSSYRVGLQGAHAVALAWDATEVAALLAGAGLPEGTALIPEGLLREPGEPGIRLLAVLEGFEGQVWVSGVLMHSHWWPAEPTALQWQDFLRHRDAARWPGPSARVVEAGWLGRPWLRVSPPDQWVDPVAAGARRLGPVVAGALGVVAGIQLHDYFEASSRLAAARLEQAALAERARPWAAAREESRRLSEQANRLAVALRGPEPVEVLAELAQGLPAKGVRLQELALEGSSLRLLIDVAPDVPRTAVVGSLQASGYFSEVRETAATQPGGSLGFTLKITGRP